MPDLKNESDFEDGVECEEHHVKASQSLSEASTAVPGSQSVSEASSAVPASQTLSQVSTAVCVASESSLLDLKDDQDRPGFEDATKLVEREKFETPPSYHEFLDRDRDFCQLAVELWKKHKGLDLFKGPPTEDELLQQFFHRYNPGVDDDRVLWSFVYEERQGPGPKLQYLATLRAHSLGQREFQGREWCVSLRLAQIAAIKVFRADRDVQEIAKWLAPPQAKIRERLDLNQNEKKKLKREGIDISMVFKELVQCVYIHFPRFGCRNAIVDGFA